jgi:hypothetical protein
MAGQVGRNKRREASLTAPYVRGDNLPKKSYPRRQNRIYHDRTLLAEGRHLEASWWWSRPEADVEMRVQIRRPVRETAAAGAAPAREVRSLAPGRLRDPPWGYYGPCARSSLTAPVHLGDTQARTEAEPWSRKAVARAAAQRREARRPASWAGDLRRPGDGPSREAGHGVRRFRTSACRRSAPLIFFGGGKQTRGTRPLPIGPAERWLKPAQKA